MLKDPRHHYVVYLPEEAPFERDDFSRIHDQHWQIEQYHRAIEQVCHIEYFQMRSEQPVRNHIIEAILAFVALCSFKGWCFTSIHPAPRTSRTGLYAH